MSNNKIEEKVEIKKVKLSQVKEIPHNMSDLIIKFMNKVSKGEATIVVTGTQGTGKTTLLDSFATLPASPYSNKVIESSN